MKPFSPLLFDSTRNRGKQFLNELISTFYFRGFIVRLLRSGSATRRCGRRRKRRRQRRLHARRCRERVQLVCMPVLTRSKWTSRSWALWPRARMSVIEWSTQPSMPSPPPPDRIEFWLAFQAVSILWEFVKNHLPSSSPLMMSVWHGFYGLLLPFLSFTCFEHRHDDRWWWSDFEGKECLPMLTPKSTQLIRPQKAFQFYDEISSSEIIFDFLMARQISWHESTHKYSGTGAQSGHKITPIAIIN